MHSPRRVRTPTLKRNEHLDRLEEHFGPILHEPTDLPADLSYVFICFTNRSGSNYIAEMLAAGGDYNLAGEILNWPGVKQAAQRRGHARFQDFFAHAVAHRAKSGFFFLKAALPHLEILAKAGVLDQVAARSQFILTERNDTLAQAISHAIAFGTGGFTSETPTALQPHEMEYSRATIDRALNAIALSRRQFAVFFGRNGIVPLRVIYERLAADPDEEVSWLARQIGLPNFALDRAKLRLERQAGPVNDDWRRRYLSERRHRDNSEF